LQVLNQNEDLSDFYTALIKLPFSGMTVRELLWVYLVLWLFYFITTTWTY